MKKPKFGPKNPRISLGYEYKLGWVHGLTVDEMVDVRRAVQHHIKSELEPLVSTRAPAAAGSAPDEERMYELDTQISAAASYVNETLRSRPIRGGRRFGATPEGDSRICEYNYDTGEHENALCLGLLDENDRPYFFEAKTSTGKSVNVPIRALFRWDCTFEDDPE